MPFEQITLEKEEDIAVVTLNRPERLNAWTQQMNGELVEAAFVQALIFEIISRPVLMVTTSESSTTG